MASLAEQDSASDLVFLALLLAGAYVVVNVLRNSQAATAEATDGGAPAFDPTPPPPDNPAQSFLQVLAPMQLSPAGAAFIKKQEGFTAKFQSDAGHQSIGYGHDVLPGENIVPPITRAEAQQLFEGDAAIAAAAVRNGLNVQVSQNQFDALVDFAFNVGAGAFANSTLLRQLNAGDFAGAAQQFSRWIYSAGSVNNGLVARRAAEAQVFNS